MVSTLPDQLSANPWSRLLDPSRLQLVSSLYGPGTFGAWLCTVASVLTTWTLHPTHARASGMTNDFIAALALPAVSACHFIAQYYYPPAPVSALGEDSPVDIWSSLDTAAIPLLLSHEDASLRRLAALEAPLVVCDIFVVLSVLLWALALRRGQLLRAGCAAVVGTLCLVPQYLLFAFLPGASVSEVKFTRPFIFEFSAALAFYTTCFIGIAGSFAVEALIVYYGRRSGINLSPRSSIGASQSEDSTTRTSSERGNPRPGWLTALPAVMTALTLLALDIVISAGFAGNTPLYTLQIPLYMHYLRFLPKTTAGIMDLDQMVTLVGGMVTLWFSIYDAWKARKTLAETISQESRRRNKRIWPRRRYARTRLEMVGRRTKYA